MDIANVLRNQFQFLAQETLGGGSCTLRYTFWNTFFSSLKPFLTGNLPPVNVIRENGFTYNELPVGSMIGTNTMIHGYFQSEKYFKDYRNDLLKEFAFKKHIFEKATTVRSVTKDPVISAHLRLGDYKNLVGKHPIMQKEYYLQALDMLPKDLLIIGFSDEPEEASKVFDSLGRKYFITEPDDQYTDMCTMTLCNYHVIANSSYSWWGAWLSDSKKVIAPYNWFGEDDVMPQNWSDIYCKDWTVI